MTAGLRSSLPLIALAASGCSTLSFDDGVAEYVERVDEARLRAHVAMLTGIGPRPVTDAEATERAVTALTRELEGLGYEVERESVEVRLQSRMVASVRPAGDPDAEVTELDLGPALGIGAHVMRSTSERLASEGWKVEGYELRGIGEPRTLTVPNLIATRRGSVAPREVLELGAHYDTVPFSPGAVDNASGVAALLEVARVVADAPTERTLRFCFFGAEEVRKRGSVVHVERLLSTPSERVAGLINLDSVGYRDATPGSQREPEDTPWFLSLPDRADFVAVVGNWSSGWLGNLVEDAIDAYATELPYYSANRIGAWFQDARRSDHANYWEAGLDATWLTDMGEYRNDAYHGPRDTDERVDLGFLAGITRATAAACLHWARLTLRER